MKTLLKLTLVAPKFIFSFSVLSTKTSVVRSTPTFATFQTFEFAIKLMKNNVWQRSGHSSNYNAKSLPKLLDTKGLLKVRFGQAKFPDGGSVLGQSQFSTLPKLPPTILFDLKVVKIDPN